VVTLRFQPLKETLNRKPLRFDETKRRPELFEGTWKVKNISRVGNEVPSSVFIILALITCSFIVFYKLFQILKNY